MTKIHLILEDEEGGQLKRSFSLVGDLESLDGIDEAVEGFSRAALPQIEAHLVEEAQKRAVEEAKKNSL